MTCDVAIVAGAGFGIGRAIAHRLAKDGMAARYATGQTVVIDCGRLVSRYLGPATRGDRFDEANCNVLVEEVTLNG